jgi:hypothetical protein
MFSDQSLCKRERVQKITAGSYENVCLNFSLFVEQLLHWSHVFWRKNIQFSQH